MRSVVFLVALLANSWLYLYQFHGSFLTNISTSILLSLNKCNMSSHYSLSDSSLKLTTVWPRACSGDEGGPGEILGTMALFRRITMCFILSVLLTAYSNHCKNCHVGPMPSIPIPLFATFLFFISRLKKNVFWSRVIFCASSQSITTGCN